MDQEVVNDLLRSQEEGLIERIFVEDVSRSSWAWRKEVFQEGKNTQDESLTQATQSKYHIKLWKHISNKMQSLKIQNTHTHTQNKSNQFYTSKTSWVSLVNIY